MVLDLDKRRIYTSVNAGELKPGDKAYVSDSIEGLKNYVSKKLAGGLWRIKGILPEDAVHRFQVETHRGTEVFTLAYLVERAQNCTNCGLRRRCCRQVQPNPELTKCGDYIAETKTIEKTWRPFKDTAELVKVWGDKIGGYDLADKLTMPRIWVRKKNEPTSKGDLITAYGEAGVTIDTHGCYMKELLDYFEFLDGSPCGVEVLEVTE